ncbi:MAG TPA: CocE/NonD family hydrolase [Terriglobales bacterium]|nr:CocE/NonD family hydrolase [Terriglobales bacterium]
MALLYPMRARMRTTWAVFILLLLSALAGAQNGPKTDKEKELAEWVRANYTKYEHRIAMRDGVRLFTAVYVPKDASATNTYPIMFDRTPYNVGPYGTENYRSPLGPNELFTRAKYIFAYQDVRGRFMSEGEFVDVRPYNPAKKSNKDIDEASDTYDSIDWLVKNVRFNNGKVGMWGISYPGFYVSMGLIDPHPALKAGSPQAPIGDWFLGDDFHHNGALWLPHMFNFMIVFGKPRPQLTTKWDRDFEPGTPDGYNFFLNNVEPLSKVNDSYYKNQVKFWNDVVAHPNYDAFWKARNAPQYLKNIKPATLTVGGWFDAEDVWGALNTAEAIAKNNPAVPPTMVMGPWFHGGWERSDGDRLGDVRFGSKTSEFYRQNIELPFFEYHLKGNGQLDFPRAWVFETGRNEWQKYDAWPPPKAVKKSLYFGTNGRLSFDLQEAMTCGAATQSRTQTSSEPLGGNRCGPFDEYVSDPAKPVPFIDQTSMSMERTYMTADQRLQGRRPDVLTYQTEPLEEDVTLAGPVKPSLFVSTTGTDSDFVVKLIDVYPDDAPDYEPNPANIKMGGYQQLVRGEPMRGRFRNSFEKPEPFEPGKATKVEFVMPDVNHTFRRGHRIMVQVQSTWFPLVDINPQKFVENIYLAKPTDFQKATQRLYRQSNNASRVDVLVLHK